MITSDSLAAESLQNNGSFAGNQDGITASQQRGTGFAGATTDTSGAEILGSTSDRANRDADTMDSYRTPADVQSGTYAAQDSGVSSGTYNTSAGGPQESLGTAPSAYSSAGGSDENMQPRPHGKNIRDVTDSGFDGQNQEAGVTTDMGGKSDPGRYAENSYIAGNQRGASDAGYPNATQGADAGRNQGGFENLSEETSS